LLVSSLVVTTSMNGLGDLSVLSTTCVRDAGATPVPAVSFIIKEDELWRYPLRQLIRILSKS